MGELQSPVNCADRIARIEQDERPRYDARVGTAPNHDVAMVAVSRSLEIAAQGSSEPAFSATALKTRGADT